MAAAWSSSCPSRYTSGRALGQRLGRLLERPPGCGVQDVLDLPQRDAGQLGQVPGGQAAAGGGQQPEQVLLGRAAAQQPLQFLPGKPLHVPGVRGGDSGRMIAVSRSGCQSGTSSGTGGSGRLATITRIPAGGSAGSSPAMLWASGPVVTPGPHPARPPPAPAARPPPGMRRGLGHQVQQVRLPGRLRQHRRQGLAQQGGSCSSSTSVNASRVSCAASRAVMKNDTIRTRSATSAAGAARTWTAAPTSPPRARPATTHTAPHPGPGRTGPAPLFPRPGPSGLAGQAARSAAPAPGTPTAPLPAGAPGTRSHPGRSRFPGRPE